MGTVQKIQGNTLDKILVDLRLQFFFLGHIYVSLSRVRKSEDVLLLHEAENTPSDAAKLYNMRFDVHNPFLLEAVEFEEGN